MSGRTSRGRDPLLVAYTEHAEIMSLEERMVAVSRFNSRDAVSESRYFWWQQTLRERHAAAG